jgi:outer membrane protein assembly factor BamB
LVWENVLLIQFDTNEIGKVLGLDINSGDQLWETIRTSKISWASPILARVKDHYELILASSPNVAAYDPKSGKELWVYPCLSGEVGPSPAFYKGTVFAANEYARLVAFIPGNPTRVVWENNEYLPEVSSPVATDGLLFVCTSYGVIACYNTDTGEILWEYESNEGFYASPIVADGKVFFLDRGGKMYIFSVNKTLKLISDPELGEGTVSTPAFSNGKIFIRGYDHLFCIGTG